MLELRGSYRFASPDIIHEVFDGECVILNLASGTYYALSVSASRLIESLLQGTAIENLATLHGPAYQCDDVEAFFEKLVTLGLIMPTSTLESPGHAISDTLRLKSKSWPDRPTIEVFDDLADLILADPIHDTDEAVGWPTMANTKERAA